MDKDKSDKKEAMKKLKKTNIWIIGFVIVAFVLYASAIIILTWPISELSIEKSGQFGDSFGVLTSLFSGLAFAGIIITILMQRIDLQIQHDELELTRKEIKGQKIELEKQNETMELQQFEHSFFLLFDIFINYQEKITVDRSGGVFHKIVSGLKSDSIAQQFEIPLNDERSNKFIKKYYDDNRFILDKYFANLNNLLRFLEKSEIKHKSIYYDILSAQFDANNAIGLFYYGWFSEDLRSSINKHGFLRHIDDTLLLKGQHRAIYEHTAYEKQ